MAIRVFVLCIISSLAASSSASQNINSQPNDNVRQARRISRQMAPGQVSLFDGTQLGQWKVTDFNEEGKVYVKDGSIILQKGNNLTGVTWTGRLPRTNYEINLDAMRLDGEDFFCGLTFPVGDSFVTFIEAGWGGNVCGISCIDYYDASDNETTVKANFDNNRWYHFRVRVTPGKIQCWIDDRQYVDLDTKGKKLDLRFEVKKSSPLGIASWCTTAAIKNIRLTKLQIAEPPSTGKSPLPSDPGPVPGVVIDYLAPALHDYVGSPSIAILPNGRYVASHDIFGDGPRSKGPRTLVFESADSGRTWRQLAELIPQFWSSLFVHRGQLYIIGIGRGDIIIRRSADGGKTWSNPKDKSTGLLAKGRFHCAPVPVVVHKGRIWRGFEVDQGHYRWQAFVMSAPAGSDLLNADNWLMSDKLMVDKRANIFKWLEGNVVVTPDGNIVDILRTQKPPARAAMIHISEDGMKLTFDPVRDMISFPGGAKKFTIRYDKASGKYWSLVNIITDPGKLEEPPQDHRNTLALTCSEDLRTWEVRKIVLSFRQGQHLTRKNNKFGFQYVDWLIDHDDIIFVSRTAWGWDTPRSHDANYLTFHRIKNFRQTTSPPPNPARQ